VLTRPTDIVVYYSKTGENIQFLILAITGGREIGERKEKDVRI
jgi:hypothetical protein